MKLRFIISLLALTLSFSQLSAQRKNKAYLDYIEKYSSLAVKHQKQYGIPASITLAQGLLESGAGRSELARPTIISVSNVIAIGRGRGFITTMIRKTIVSVNIINRKIRLKIMPVS